MKVCKAHAANFETLKCAFAHNQVCLIETQLVETHEVVATLAAFSEDPDTGEVVFTPFCIFLNGNPYKLLRPPDPNGEGFLDSDMGET